MEKWNLFFKEQLKLVSFKNTVKPFLGKLLASPDVKLNNDTVNKLYKYEKVKQKDTILTANVKKLIQSKEPLSSVVSIKSNDNRSYYYYAYSINS